MRAVVRAIRERVIPAVHELFWTSSHRRRTATAAQRAGYRLRGGTWTVGHLYPAVMEDRNRWMGARAQKNPLDVWIYQEILWDVRPDAIVELGSAHGGGTLFWCHMLDLLAIDGPVITVDHNHDDFDADHPRIHKVTGDTQDTQVVSQVRELCAGRRVLVLHDANHQAPAVLADLRIYAPLVSPGSYLIVEDGVRDTIAGKPGPAQAARQYLAETPEFELDESRERFLLGYNPSGFLHRRG